MLVKYNGSKGACVRACGFRWKVHCCHWRARHLAKAAASDSNAGTYFFITPLPLAKCAEFGYFVPIQHRWRTSCKVQWCLSIVYLALLKVTSDCQPTFVWNYKNCEHKLSV